MRKVRIVALPKAGGGVEVNNKLFNGNQSGFPTKFGQFSDPGPEVRTTLEGVDREDANLEAEKGETMIMNQGGIPTQFKIGGKPHSQGGTPLKAPDGSFVFSKTKDMKIKDPTILEQFGVTANSATPAEIAKKYDINNYRKTLGDSNSSKLEVKTAELMISNYNLKLAKLALVQESMKGFPQGIPAISMPYIESMQIDPSEFAATQGQQEQVNPDMNAKFGGGLPKHQSPPGQTGTKPNTDLDLSGLMEVIKKADAEKVAQEKARQAAYEARVAAEKDKKRLKELANEEATRKHNLYVQTNELERRKGKISQWTNDYAESQKQLADLHSGKRLFAGVQIPNVDDVKSYINDYNQYADKVDPDRNKKYYLTDYNTGKLKQVSKEESDAYAKEQERIKNYKMSPEEAAYYKSKAISTPVDVTPETTVQPGVVPIKKVAPADTIKVSVKGKNPYLEIGGELETAGDGKTTGQVKVTNFDDGTSIITDPDGTVKVYTGKDGTGVLKKTIPGKKGTNNPSIDTYTDPTQAMIKAKQAEGFDVDLTQTQPGGTPKEKRDRLANQHLRKGQKNVFGDIEWNDKTKADLQRRQPWIFEKYPDWDPNNTEQVKWAQDEYDKMHPGYYDQKDAKGNYIQGTSKNGKFGEHTFSMPGFKKKAAVATTETAATEEEKAKAAAAGTGMIPEQQSGYAPWWRQDVVKTAGAAGDFFRVKKYDPWQAVPGVTLPEATFYDPTRELAASAEAANLGAQGLAAFQNPQAYAAGFSAIQGQSAKNAADIMGRYENLNVGVANQVSSQNAGILNNYEMNRANLATGLFDKYTIANQQFDNAKNMARQNLRQSYIDAVTNKNNTANLNDLYDQYKIDPSTGGRIRWTHGRPIKPDTSEKDLFTQFSDLRTKLPADVTDDAIFKYLTAGKSKETTSQGNGIYDEAALRGR